MELKKVFWSGIIKENPVFVLLLAMCPALGVTSSVVNSVGMGLTVTFVLLISNIIISIIRGIIPDEIRIPVFIIIIASAATILEMIIQAYMPDLHKSLGIFLPLVATNCIVFGRAESFASKSGIIPSIIDGLGMGLGFLLSLVLLGFSRELIGTGGINLFGLNMQVFPSDYAISLFIQPAGAFIALGVIIGIITTIGINKEEKIQSQLKAAKVAATKAGVK